MRKLAIKVITTLVLTGFLWLLGNTLYSLTGCSIQLFYVGFKEPIFCTILQKSILPIAFLLSLATTILLFRGRK